MVFKGMNEAGIVSDITIHTYLVKTFVKLGELQNCF